MEIERAGVLRRPDGQRVIDIALRRRVDADSFAPPVAGTSAEEPLVLPQFDDEDSDSSSDDESSITYRRSTKATRHHAGPQRNNFNNNNNEDENDADDCRNTNTLPENIQWDGVNQIQQLTNENSALNDQVETLKQQLKSMEIQMEALAPVPGLNIDAVQDILLDKDAIDHDVRDAKIVHQAKMIRQLKRSIQRDKQHAVDALKQRKAAEEARTKLEKEVDMLRLKLQRVEARAAAANAGSTGVNEESSPNSKISAGTSSAVVEVKKQCEELKSKNAALLLELKRTQRALAREVGDEISLEEVVNGSGTGNEGRRGRAQQIIMLKAKLKKLKTEIAGRPLPGTDEKSVLNEITPPALDVDERAQKELANQGAHRQKQIDKLTAERDTLKESVQDQSRKLEALKSRTQILEKEKQDARTKIQVLVDKSRTDDALVDALQRQLEVLKRKCQDAKRELKSSGGGSERNESFMPAPSETAQFRAVAAEKERLSELVKTLSLQLEEKDRQLRAASGIQPQLAHLSLLSQTSPSGIGSQLSQLPNVLGPSRIPRKPVRPGSVSDRETASTPPMSAGSARSRVEELESEVETLRRTLRENIREKDDRIAELERRQQALPDINSSRKHSNREDPSVSSDDETRALAQEVEDLQEENQFLRDEFDKLKTRYEALTRSGGRR